MSPIFFVSQGVLSIATPGRGTDLSWFSRPTCRGMGWDLLVLQEAHALQTAQLI